MTQCWSGTHAPSRPEAVTGRPRTGAGRHGAHLLRACNRHQRAAARQLHRLLVLLQRERLPGDAALEPGDVTTARRAPCHPRRRAPSAANARHVMLRRLRWGAGRALGGISGDGYRCSYDWSRLRLRGWSSGRRNGARLRLQDEFRRLRLRQHLGGYGSGCLRRCLHCRLSVGMTLWLPHAAVAGADGLKARTGHCQAESRGESGEHTCAAPPLRSLACPSAASAAGGELQGSAAAAEAAGADSSLEARSDVVVRGRDDSGRASPARPRPGAESSPFQRTLLRVGVEGTRGRGEGTRCACSACMPCACACACRRVMHVSKKPSASL